MKESIYKGHPMLELGEIHGKPFSLGVTKLKLIAENIDSIKVFLEKYNTVEAVADTTPKKLSLFGGD